MLNRTGLLSVIAVAVLAACAKSPPPASVEDAARTKAQAAATAADNEEAPPPVATDPQAVPPPMDRSKKAAGLLALIDTAPQCQSYRTQLEEAGRIPADSPQAVDMNQIVASAHDAGCGRKP